jgi:hypothetical protein
MGQSHSHLVARLSDAQEQLAGAHSDLAALQLRVQEQQQHYDQLHSSYLVLEQQLQATQTMLWGNIRQLQQELQQAITEKQQLQAVRAAGRGRGLISTWPEQGSPATWRVFPRVGVPCKAHCGTPAAILVCRAKVHSAVLLLYSHAKVDSSLNTRHGD